MRINLAGLDMLCDQISNLKTNRCFRRFLRIKWAARAYFGLAALPISTYAQAQTIESPNNRRKDFYDILQNVKDRKIDDFWTRMPKFAKIAFFYVLLTTMTNYFTRVWTFKRLEEMTFDYIKRQNRYQKQLTTYPRGYLPLCRGGEKFRLAGSRHRDDAHRLYPDTLGA